MGLIVALTFVGVFVAVALPLIAAMSGSSTARKAAATLNSAIKDEATKVNPRKQVLDVRKQELQSSIPWLNKKLRELELSPHLRRLLDQSKIGWTSGRFLAMTGFCFVVPFTIVFFGFGSLPFGLLAGLLPIWLPLALVVLKRRRRFKQFEEGLPEALDLMESALRAGQSLIAAMGLVARECPDPVGAEIRTCYEEQNFGLELKTALDNLLARVPLPDLGIFASAILIQKESGGNLAEVLENTSYLIRERFRLKKQISVHTAQGRLTGWVLIFVPVGLGIVMYCINPETMSILWHSDVGIKLIWGAIGMILLGSYVINRIVDIDI